MGSVEAAIRLASPLVLQDPTNNEWRATLARCHLSRSELASIKQSANALEDAAYAETLLLDALAAEPRRRLPPVISLEVRFGEEPGWQSVRYSNNQTYSYRYEGGDDDEGGIVATVGKGPVSGNLRLVGNKRFRILGCEFTDDPTGQLRFEGSGLAGVIFDENSEILTAKYAVIVKDMDNGGCTIPCDPMVRNVPPV